LQFHLGLIAGGSFFDIRHEDFGRDFGREFIGKWVLKCSFL
jgi:hypothetical protein